VLLLGCTDDQNSPSVDCLSSGSSSSIHPPSISSNSDSDMIRTPSLLALSNFDPDESPATRKSVFLLTEPATFAPSNCKRAFASERPISLSVPVITHVLPSRGKLSESGFSIAGQLIPSFNSASITSVLCDSLKKLKMWVATTLGLQPVLQATPRE